VLADGCMHTVTTWYQTADGSLGSPGVQPVPRLGDGDAAFGGFNADGRTDLAVLGAGRPAAPEADSPEFYLYHTWPTMPV
jgi:hypothetical protein